MGSWPSYGARGEEILYGGRGRRLSFSSLPFSLPSSPFSPETHDYSGYFYFPDASQISAMVGDHSRQMKTQICMDFAHYQSPKLLGSSPPITQVSIFGAVAAFWASPHFGHPHSHIPSVLDIPGGGCPKR